MGFHKGKDINVSVQTTILNQKYQPKFILRQKFHHIGKMFGILIWAQRSGVVAVRHFP